MAASITRSPGVGRAVEEGMSEIEFAVAISLSSAIGDEAV
jgi:hypothetical protein